MYIRILHKGDICKFLFWLVVLKSWICGCHPWDRLETSSWKVSGRIIWPWCFLRFSFNSDSPWNRKFFSRGQKGLKSSRKLATYIWNDESFHHLWVLCGKMTSAPPTKCLWSSRGVTLNYTFVYEIQAYHVKSMMYKKFLLGLYIKSNWKSTLLNLRCCSMLNFNHSSQQRLLWLRVNCPTCSKCHMFEFKSGDI